MPEEEVVRTIRDHLEGQFPKACANCGRQFVTLKDYLHNTVHVGSAMSYDAEAGNWAPLNPLGTLSYANCSCGSTLALSSSGMPLLRIWSLLNWVRVETKTRGQSHHELLTYLRNEIDKQVLAES